MTWREIIIDHRGKLTDEDRKWLIKNDKWNRDHLYDTGNLPTGKDAQDILGDKLRKKIANYFKFNRDEK